jgi:hypothetical protein
MDEDWDNDNGRIDIVGGDLSVQRPNARTQFGGVFRRANNALMRS